MRLPIIRGLIERRILVNYRVKPEVLAGLLPAPFRPQLVGGWGMAGICLIRLKQVRPRGFPSWVGFASENAAHRIAVEWDEHAELRRGVYVQRRDTNSRWNTAVGGRLFPGVHHHATFCVHETAEHYSVAVQSDDGQSAIAVEGNLGRQLPCTSVFGSLTEASDFFQAGGLGYSPSLDCCNLQGLELRCDAWNVAPLDIESVHSSFFENLACFPAGSVEFDGALLMRNIPHAWHGRPNLESVGQGSF